MPSHHIVIIGGGVTGLTTACELLQRNYQVTVIAERYANQENRITSQVAGALWEWPPAVCGRHTDIISLENSKRWCKVAYDRYKEMAAETSKESGIERRQRPKLTSADLTWLRTAPSADHPASPLL